MQDPTPRLGGLAYISLASQMNNWILNHPATKVV